MAQLHCLEQVACVRTRMARDAEQLTAASAPAATKSEAVARIAVSASSRSEDLQNYRKSAAVSSHEYAGNLAQGLSDLPVVDLGPFISGRASSSEVASSSQQLADCLHRTGCLIVRDPRATGSDSNQFLDLVERYFAQSYETKLADSRPQLHYQVCLPWKGHPTSLNSSVCLTKCSIQPWHSCFRWLPRERCSARAGNSSSLHINFWMSTQAIPSLVRHPGQECPQ